MHSVGYFCGSVYTNSIEGFWSLSMRGYYGIYHRMTINHLHRYLNEFTGRAGIRDMDTLGQMAHIAHHIRRHNAHIQEIDFMTNEEPKNSPGCPETRLLKINLVVEEAVHQMFAYGLPRNKRMGTGPKSIEPVKVRNQNRARNEASLSDSRPGT